MPCSHRHCRRLDVFSVTPGSMGRVAPLSAHWDSASQHACQWERKAADAFLLVLPPDSRREHVSPPDTTQGIATSSGLHPYTQPLTACYTSGTGLSPGPVLGEQLQDGQAGMIAATQRRCSEGEGGSWPSITTAVKNALKTKENPDRSRKHQCI